MYLKQIRCAAIHSYACSYNVKAAIAVLDHGSVSEGQLNFFRDKCALPREKRSKVQKKFKKKSDFFRIVDVIAVFLPFHKPKEFLKNLYYFLFYEIFNILDLVM